MIVITGSALSPGPHCDHILTASQDKTARLWDVEGRQLSVLRGHEGGVRSAVFSPAGDRIVTASQDKTARLWDLEGNLLAVLRGHKSEVQILKSYPNNW